MTVIVGRRGFLKGLAALVAAPAIVRAASIMPVRTPKLVVPAADFSTDSILIKSYARYAISWTDWRAVYSSFPTQHSALFEAA